MNEDSMPVPAESREVVGVRPVFDAELVDESQPFYSQPRIGRFASWWLRSPRVPVWLKYRGQARQAARDAVAAVVRSPWRYLRADGARVGGRAAVVASVGDRAGLPGSG